MRMLCLTRALWVSPIALALFPIAGCGHGAAETESAAYLAAAPSRAAPNEEIFPGRDGVVTVPEMEAEHMMQPTTIELRHFNVYRHFRAMLDAASDAHGTQARDGQRPPHTGPDTSAGQDYFACTGNGLIRPNE